MFEFIFSVVCLCVLAVEVIEVREKCEETVPGLWREMRAVEPRRSADGSPERDRLGYPARPTVGTVLNSHANHSRVDLRSAILRPGTR